MECQHPDCTNVAVYLVRAFPTMSAESMSVCAQHVVDAMVNAPRPRSNAPAAERWAVNVLDTYA